MKINKLSMIAVALAASVNVFSLETAQYHTNQEKAKILQEMANTRITHAPVTETVDTPEIRELSVAMKALKRAKATLNEAISDLAGSTVDNRPKHEEIKQKAHAHHKAKASEVKDVLQRIERIANSYSKSL